MKLNVSVERVQLPSFVGALETLDLVPHYSDYFLELMHFRLHPDLVRKAAASALSTEPAPCTKSCSNG